VIIPDNVIKAFSTLSCSIANQDNRKRDAVRRKRQKRQKSHVAYPWLQGQAEEVSTSWKILVLNKEYFSPVTLGASSGVNLKTQRAHLSFIGS